MVRGGISLLAASLASAILFPAAWAVAGAPQEVQAILAAKSLPGPDRRRRSRLPPRCGEGDILPDRRTEFSKCRSVSCAPALLPVRWKGTLPGVSESVDVRGAVRATKEGKFLFEESVKKAGK